MEIINPTEARKDIYHLINAIIQSHRPVQIKGKKGSVIMVSEEDWRAIQETLYLESIPGMGDSIVEGMNVSKDECSTKLNW